MGPQFWILVFLNNDRSGVEVNGLRSKSIFIARRLYRRIADGFISAARGAKLMRKVPACHVTFHPITTRRFRRLQQAGHVVDRAIIGLSGALLRCRRYYGKVRERRRRCFADCVMMLEL